MLHVQSAEYTLDRVDMAVLITIEFKKVVAHDIGPLRNRETCRQAM
jgi:hypothetical protein